MPRQLVHFRAYPPNPQVLWDVVSRLFTPMEEFLMRRTLVVLGALAVLATALLAGPATGLAATAKTKTLYSCVDRKTGALRIVTKTKKCTKAERKLTWVSTTGGATTPSSTTGPKGATGAPGPAGPAAPPARRARQARRARRARQAQGRAGPRGFSRHPGPGRSDRTGRRRPGPDRRTGRAGRSRPGRPAGPDRPAARRAIRARPVTRRDRPAGRAGNSGRRRRDRRAGRAGHPG